MGKLFLISAFALISIIIYPQWEEQTIPAIEANLNSAFFFNDSTVYTVGENGLIFRTSNCGRTWIVFKPIKYHFQSMHGYGLRSWIVGSEGKILYNSSTGYSESWSTQSSNVTVELRDVYFINDNTGWIAGRSGTILKTTNAGKDWMAQVSNTTLALNSIYFTDLQNGYSVGNSGTILKTTNGGTSWTSQVQFPDYSFSDVFFIDQNTGWIAGGTNSGLKGKILKTTNAGQTWLPCLDTGNNEYLYSVQFINSDIGFAAGYKGTIYKTTNGGLTWTGITKFTANNLKSLSIRKNIVFIAGAKGLILKSSNNGVTWETKPVYDNYTGIQFIDKQNGWACGSFGAIISTTDGGNFWQRRHAGTPSNLVKVFFADQSNGFCIIEDGVILKTSDGGTSWDTTYFADLEPDFTDDKGKYYSLLFLDNNKGFAGGEYYFSGNYIPSSALSSTTNGGLTWQTTFLPGSRISDIYFVNKDLGFIGTGYVDGYGWVLKTTDGGQNWRDITPDSLILNNDEEDYSFTWANFRSVYFLNKDTGWVAGDNLGYISNGFIISTYDGGRTWMKLRVGTEVCDLAFIDVDNGWAVENVRSYIPFDVNRNSMIKQGTTAHSQSQQINTAVVTLKNYDHKYKGTVSNTASVYSDRYRGRFLQTSNSGVTWNPTDFTTMLNSLCYLDKDNRWLAGNGKIYKNIPPPKENIWDDFITVSDKSGTSKILSFGINEDATDGIDTRLGEEELPPVPPAEIFDARFILPAGENSLNDFRPDNNQKVTWQFSFQSASVKFPLTFSWNSSLLPDGQFFLTDNINGNIVKVNMKLENTYTLTNTGINRLNIIYKKHPCKSIAVNESWNIISIPYQQQDMSRSVLFPEALTPAYSYNPDQGYEIQDTLSLGKGYWLKFPAERNINFCGPPPGTTIPVKSGWNMIGAFTEDLSTSDIITVPDGLINSKFYEYSNGYKSVDTLRPGKGYWIKALQDGNVNQINNSIPKVSPVENTSPSKALVEIALVCSDGSSFSDTLYFGIDPAATSGLDNSLGEEELPPMPPAGIFDARFYIPGTGLSSSKEIYSGPEENIFERTYYVQYQAGEGPNVLLSWDLPSGLTMRIQDIVTGSIIDTTFNSGPAGLTITNPDAINKLALTVKYPSGFTPVELSHFSAEQNKETIEILWETSTETNNKEFVIERKMNAGWEAAGTVKGSGTTTSPVRYTFADHFKYIAYEGVISYRIRQVDYSGAYRYTREISTKVNFLPAEFTLYPNYPNPFNPSTTIKYAIPYESKVLIEIFTIIGEKITEFSEGNKSAGYYDITWNAGSLSSGIYYYSITAVSTSGKDNYRKTRKMILVK